MLRLLSLLIAAGLTSVVPLTAAPSAYAASITIDDPDRDGREGARLDFTSVRVSNNQRAVVITADFRRVANGVLAVYVRPVGAPRQDVRVVSRHRSVEDRNSFLGSDGQQSCRGLSVAWDRERDTARVRLPARCLAAGDYDDIRVRLITERGADADLAPSTPRGDWPWSRRVPRA